LVKILLSIFYPWDILAPSAFKQTVGHIMLAYLTLK